MPQTRISCPNCRQPLMADVEQLFDVSADPSAKQKLLSGGANVVQCPNCGYRGNLATPLIYHDNEKELLLTFFPPEVGLKRDDQERLIGQLINQVVNRLPQEKRKGYLLRPQSMLTLQGLVERVLEADGITKEMLQAQQQRLSLLQRLMSATPEASAEIARQEDSLIDGEFFTLFNRLAEAAMMSEDRQSAQRLAELQKTLLSETTFGRKVEEQSREVQAAMASLQEAGESLTREKLLDLLVSAPNDTRVSALVSMARPGMDYTFFQLLSERIDRARSDGRARLVALRERLLELTRQVDEQMAARAEQSRQLLEAILKAADITQATMESLQAVDEFFLRELNAAYEEARQKSDLDRIAKLQKVVDVINQASAPPPEVNLIEQMLEAPDDAARRQIMQENSEQITPEFLDALNNIIAQVDKSGDPELASRIKALHRQALRFSMEMQMKK
jgi:hypothetical protein